MHGRQGSLDLDNRIEKPSTEGAGESPVTTLKILADWSQGTPDRATVVFDRRFVVRVSRVDGNGTFAAACNCGGDWACDHWERALEAFQLMTAARRRPRLDRSLLSACSAEVDSAKRDDDPGRPYDGLIRDTAEADVLPAACPAHVTEGRERRDHGRVWAARAPAFAYGADGIRLPLALADALARDEWMPTREKAVTRPEFGALFAEQLRKELDRRQLLVSLAAERAGYWVAKPPFTVDGNPRGGTWHAPDLILRLAYCGSWEPRFGGLSRDVAFLPLEAPLADEEVAP